MALALGTELGLKLLLSPPATSAVVRTACVGIGVGFPVYATFKAIEQKNRDEEQQWLVYWAAYGCFSIVESISDPLLSWFPLYYHAKLAFLLWLQFPHNYGASHVYKVHLRPFFLRRRVILDRLVDSTRNDMNKFAKITKESREFQTVARITKNITSSAWQFVAGDDTSSRRSSSPGDDPTWVHVDKDDDAS